MRPTPLYLLALLLYPAATRPQTGHEPVLTRPAEAPYPPKAHAAHVQGEVVVRFTVLTTGRTSAIQTVSGPQLLTRPLEQMIRNWHFSTPLPVGAETHFVAVYDYHLVEPEGKSEDKQADVASEDAYAQRNAIFLPGEHATVSGVVRSENNRQEIDVTPADPQPSRTPIPRE